MPAFTIYFNGCDRMPELLEQRANELGITLEQLVKRFINDGMRSTENTGPVISGESLDDFFVKNGALKPV